MPRPHKRDYHDKGEHELAEGQIDLSTIMYPRTPVFSFREGFEEQVWESEEWSPLQLTQEEKLGQGR